MGHALLRRHTFSGALGLPWFGHLPYICPFPTYSILFLIFVCVLHIDLKLGLNIGESYYIHLSLSRFFDTLKMFRRQRSTEPDPVALHLGRVLKPTSVMLWGGQVMYFLGVPIVLGVCRSFKYPFACYPILTEKPRIR